MRTAWPSGRFDKHAGVEDGMILSWLAKLVASIALAGILLIEGGAVLIARYQASEAASRASSDAAFAVRDTDLAGRPEEAARAAAMAHGSVLVAFSKNQDAGTVTATVEKRAATLFVQRIPALRKYVSATMSETTSYLPR